MSTLKAASIGRVFHSVGTRLDITATFPAEYDPDGSTAVFELADSDGVSFRIESGVDSNLDINGQSVELRLTPSAASVGVNVGALFSDSIPEVGEIVKFNLDLERGGLVEYRFQGELKILPTHGKFKL